MPEKFFILKSLTLHDLEVGVRNRTWVTQSHNEAALSHAFREVDNVYLIFSANKSGEFFGYARMMSTISCEPAVVGPAPTLRSLATSDGPKVITTPENETAPRGRIVDDTARGTNFWEAEPSAADVGSSPRKELEKYSGKGLERNFKIEWISINRLPFYRTRGLRNPWNANKEVKIARDGTELEPSVGKRLLQMFHRPSQMLGLSTPMLQHGTPCQLA